MEVVVVRMTHLTKTLAPKIPPLSQRYNKDTNQIMEGGEEEGTPLLTHPQA